jgi:hypothetical protein
MLASEQGRELIWRRWVESVIALEQIKSTGVSRARCGNEKSADGRTKSHRSHSTRSRRTSSPSRPWLRSERRAQSSCAMWWPMPRRRAGRGTFWRRWTSDRDDVSVAPRRLQDQAEEAAVYWHDALLAARAHTSVLSANNQLLAALTGHEGEAFVQADAAQVGAGSPGARTTSLEDAWGVDASVSSAPLSPSIRRHVPLGAGLSCPSPRGDAADS